VAFDGKKLICQHLAVSISMQVLGLLILTTFTGLQKYVTNGMLMGIFGDWI
jgi:hypothetical protein